MKFSLFAGAAFFVAGVFAAPQVEQDRTGVAKRAAINAELTATLSSGVANAQKLASEITSTAKGAADVTAVLTVAPKLDDLASLLGNITTVLNSLAPANSGVGLGAIVTGVVNTVGNLVGGLLSSLGLRKRDDLLSGAISTLTGVLSTLNVTGLVGSLLTTVTGVVTTVTNVLGGLVDTVDPSASADVAKLVDTLNSILSQLNTISSTLST